VLACTTRQGQAGLGNWSEAARNRDQLGPGPGHKSDAAQPEHRYYGATKIRVLPVCPVPGRGSAAPRGHPLRRRRTRPPVRQAVARIRTAGHPATRLHPAHPRSPYGGPCHRVRSPRRRRGRPGTPEGPPDSRSKMRDPQGPSLAAQRQWGIGRTIAVRRAARRVRLRSHQLAIRYRIGAMVMGWRMPFSCSARLGPCATLDRVAASTSALARISSGPARPAIRAAMWTPRPV
jgi:hypothetical protein